MFVLNSFGDTLTPNNILYGVTSANLSFILIFDHSIICKTIQYIDQSHNRSQNMLGFNTIRIGRLITDWLVENMNTDMTP